MIPIIMPRQGQSVESCIITKWHKKQGDTVAPGDLLFSYETDKAAFDEEAKTGGTVLALLFAEGDDVPCLTNVMLLGDPDEDGSQLSGGEDMPRDTAPTGHGGEAAQARPTVTAVRTSARISPRARALANRTGADLSLAEATGPQGRLIARDVQALVDAGKVVTPAARGLVAEGASGTGLGGRVTLGDAGAAGERILSAPAAPVLPVTPSSPAPVAAMPETWDKPLPNIRKVIARAMHESLTSMAQLTHTATYDATNILALRAQFKAQGAAFGMQGVTIGDLIVFAVTRTLTQPEHAHLNAHFLGDSMRYFRDVQLGIAVDTPRGLMVPVLRDANKKTLLEISAETKALAAACQSGSVDPDLLTGGSFTVSNLGAFEVEHFTPVVNPPQTGILGVNTIQQRVRERNGQIEVYSAMSISLTYDHRALDGAPASRFLRDLKRNLENIQMLLGGGRFHV